MVYFEKAYARRGKPLVRGSYIGTAAVLLIGLTGATSEANAKAHCPLGQIYRVTKGVCVSRSAAAASGIPLYHGASFHRTSSPRVIVKVVTKTKIVYVPRPSVSDDPDGHAQARAQLADVSGSRKDKPVKKPELVEARQIAKSTSTSPFGLLPATVGKNPDRIIAE